MIENTCMYTVYSTCYIYIFIYSIIYTMFTLNLGERFRFQAMFSIVVLLCVALVCAYSQLKPVWLASFKPVALLGVWSEAQKRIPHWVWAPLLPGSDGSVEIRPYWKQTPASLRGAPFTTEPWLFKANLGCLEVNFFDYVDSAIDVCLSLDVICSLISIGSHGSLVPSIAGLP